MPWRVNKVEGRSTMLDFRTSGQGRVKVRQVWLDGHCFANQVESTSWSENEFQVSVCEACGYESCNYGGYVRVRSLRSERLVLPCFDLMDSDDEFESQHFTPPYLLRKLGIPVLSDDRWKDLRRLAPGLPDAPLPVSSTEVAYGLVFEAPGRSFKTTAEGPALDRSAFLATTTDWTLSELTTALESEWEKLVRNPAPVEARPLLPSDRAIGVILDDRRFTEWTPAVEDGEGRLHLRWGEWVVKQEDE